MNASMESHCLPFSKIPHPTKLFSTFAENFDKVAAYYGEPPSVAGVLAARRKIELDEKVRREVVEILREQNEAFGTGPDTVRNLERLAKGAAAIVTGQQVGLFAGPAYSLYKAISVVRYAEEITKAGVDSVPVFWLATEDHDFAEINHVAWNSKKGLAEFELGERESDAGRRVGDLAERMDVGRDDHGRLRLWDQLGGLFLSDLQERPRAHVARRYPAGG